MTVDYNKILFGNLFGLVVLQKSPIMGDNNQTTELSVN